MSRFDDLGKLRRVCDACGGELHHPPGRGRPRRYCDDDCAADARDERRRQEAAFDAAADLREVRAGVDALRLELRAVVHQGDALASASLAELEGEFGVHEGSPWALARRAVSGRLSGKWRDFERVSSLAEPEDEFGGGR